jgi:hypothetical protein
MISGGILKSPWALIYLFIYTVWIRGWHFGFGYIFRGVGKVVTAAKRMFKIKVNEEED